MPAERVRVITTVTPTGSSAALAGAALSSTDRLNISRKETRVQGKSFDIRQRRYHRAKSAAHAQLGMMTWLGIHDSTGRLGSFDPLRRQHLSRYAPDPSKMPSQFEAGGWSSPSDHATDSLFGWTQTQGTVGCGPDGLGLTMTAGQISYTTTYASAGPLTVWWGGGSAATFELWVGGSKIGSTVDTSSTGAGKAGQQTFTIPLCFFQNIEIRCITGTLKFWGIENRLNMSSIGVRWINLCHSGWAHADYMAGSTYTDLKAMVLALQPDMIFDGLFINDDAAGATAYGTSLTNMHNDLLALAPQTSYAAIAMHGGLNHNNASAMHDVFVDVTRDLNITQVDLFELLGMIDWRAFANGNSGAAKTISAASGNQHTLTLTANTTLTLAGAVNGTYSEINLTITQNGTGGWTVTWPASVAWNSGSPPTINPTASAQTTVNLFSSDGGVSWHEHAGSVVADGVHFSTLGNKVLELLLTGVFDGQFVDAWGYIDATGNRVGSKVRLGTGPSTNGNVSYDGTFGDALSLLASDGSTRIPIYLGKSAGPLQALRQDQVRVGRLSKTASFTIAASDVDNELAMNNAAPAVITLPQDSAASVQVGVAIEITRLTANAVTFAAGTGATLQMIGTGITAQYGKAHAKKVAANTWHVYGNVS